MRLKKTPETEFSKLKDQVGDKIPNLTLTSEKPENSWTFYQVKSGDTPVSSVVFGGQEAMAAFEFVVSVLKYFS